MNVTEYLTSGIVELYAMNALSPEEKTEFERLMILYPEISDELQRTEHTLEKYAIAHSLNPGSQLRSRVMTEIPGNKSESPAKTTQKKNQDNNNHYLTYKYMIAASLAALVVSTFASWFFYMRWDESEGNYSTLLSEKNEVIQNYNLIRSAYEETVSGLVIMRDEKTSVIELKSTDSTSHYQVRVYWNKQNKRTYIDVLLLPDPAEGKQYQLWAQSGKAITDAGVFSTGAAGLQRVKDITEADQWSITLEPKGGSIIPSSGQIFLRSDIK